MKEGIIKKHKDIALSLLKGYKKANELILKERKKRLAIITTEEALREYDYLCKLYSTADKRGLERLDNIKISFLIKRRNIFNRIRKAQGNK